MSTVDLAVPAQPARKSKLTTTSRVLGVIACIVVGSAVALTVLSLAMESGALQTMSALLIVPGATIIAALMGLVGLILAILAGVRHRGGAPFAGAGSARPRWAPALLLNLIGGLTLPILIAVIFMTDA